MLKAITKIVLVLCLLSTCVMLYNLGINSVLFMVIFSLWMILPYFTMTILLLTKLIPVKNVNILSAGVGLASIGGVIMFVDVMYLHPDPQGAIAVALIPVLQMFLLFVWNIVFKNLTSDT
ncbi:hypothetical protein L4X63_09700 [Geomonas sp. Red32]|uniref:hypothetical protein n=1 Tax=Geomonas sp. Red32 TaxID=2912856 RepID=UPI00202CEA36|nr:hypothetical protein [Geomonas sp. Red32]MCM0081863.1 hypothetical protein [Geomonas sp. Red32]